VDECLGRAVAAALTAAGHQVGPYDEFLGVPDVDWLPRIGERRWVLLTKDKHIRRNQLEVDAILNAGVRAFVLTAANLHRNDMAALFCRAMPKIYRICHQRGPFIYNITAGGRISQLSNRKLRRHALWKPSDARRG
jgi:hypothetical protein